MSAALNLVAAYVRPFAMHVLVSSIVLALALVVSLSPRLTARTRFAVLVIALAKFLVPASLFMPLVRSALPSAPRIVARVAGGAFTFPAFQPPAAARFGAIDIVAAVWITVALFCIAAVFIIRQRVLDAATRNAAPPMPRESAALDAARLRAGTTHGIDIIRSPLCEAPAVLRILRPVVVLPLHGSEHLHDDELESLLTHECAHVARRDNLVALVEALLRAVFWFNPLLWLAHRRLIVEREKACDEIVADTADRAGTYAGAITKMCAAIINRPIAGLACMAGSNLKERMEYIMRFSSLRSRAFSHALSLTSSTIVILVATVASAAMVSGNTAASSGQQAYDVSAVISKLRNGFFNVVINATDAKEQRRAWSPMLYVGPGERAQTRSSSQYRNATIEFVADATVAANGDGTIDVDVFRDGVKVQSTTLHPHAVENAPFTGEPISINLKNADLHDVLKALGQIAGLEIICPPDINAGVTVNYVDMPWDEVLYRVVSDSGLRYRIDGKKVTIMR